MAFGVALFAVAFAAALVPIAWHAYTEYQDSRISPVVASPAQFEEIFGIALSAIDPQGEPLPPPAPGEPPRPVEQKPVVLLDETITFCEGQASANSLCEPDVDETILYPGIDSQIPQGFRKELVAANRAPAHIKCHESLRVHCAKPEAVYALLRANGAWHNFYAKFPNTAGLINASNIVLSKDGSTALAYITYGCGSMCGAGTLVLLKRGEATWVAVKQVRVFDV